MQRDVIAQFNEILAGKPLLEEVMRGGRRLERGQVSLEQNRAYAQEQIEALPPELRALQYTGPKYSVTVSERLRRTAEKLREKDKYKGN